MPKRTRQQQDKHNENRRNAKKEGKKAIVCMKYIAIKYPIIHEKVCKLYECINALYPEKRDLTKTPEFMRSTEEAVNIDLLQPVLEIPLMTKQASTSKEMPQNDTPEEIPSAIDVLDEEIQTIITELRQDPDLESIFNNFQMQEITVENTVETTVETSSFASDIDKIIQEEFNALGENFPDITDNEDHLFW